jgi:hypothetical protein
MALSWPSKDPDEVLDYSIDWSQRLDDDTITDSDWSISEGTGTLEIDSVSSGSQTSTVWLSAGSDGDRYTLVNRITTAAGRTMDQSVRIRIRPR